MKTDGRTTRDRGTYWSIHNGIREDKILYGRWCGISSRIKNKKRDDYYGKGITRCSEWDDFAVFRDWSKQNGYRPELQIDRIDNDGNYEPSNCRWVTPSVNAGNRGPSFNNRFSIDEQSELAEVYATTNISLRSLSRFVGVGLPVLSDFFKSCDIKVERKRRENYAIQY